MFGNGSDGALNVASGTTNLNLDQKYQYTTVSVASGATLSTTATSGSVLYILATTSINIAGTIDVSGKITLGDNIASVTIDGVTYANPSTARGGRGGGTYGWWWALWGPQRGYGSGGEGGWVLRDQVAGAVLYGGDNGQYGLPRGSGAASVTRAVTNGGIDWANGLAGGFLAGGSGSVEVYAFGTTTASATSGSGGSTAGQDGGNGTISETGVQARNSHSAAGGGAGGNPGQPGVHVVLKAPSVTIGGTIITSGTAGQKGGDGGQNFFARSIQNNYSLYDGRGNGAGGGGGGNAGSVRIAYSTAYSNTGTINRAGGAPGAGGIGARLGEYGTPGNMGALLVEEVPGTQPTAVATQLSGGMSGGYGSFWFGNNHAGKATEYSSITQDRNQTGNARIQIVTSQTQTGNARITAVTSRTQTGNARITASTSRTQLGNARIQTTTSRTQTGNARISVTTSQNQTGNATIASLIISTTQNQTGNARIAGTSTRDQTGNARIANVTSRNQTGNARIQVIVSRTQTGNARITASTLRTQTGNARILAATSQNQTGNARIQLITSRTQTGNARITAVVLRSQIGNARIAKSVDRDQTGNASIQLVISRNQTGSALVAKELLQTQEGNARITKGIDYTEKPYLITDKAIITVNTENAKGEISISTERITIQSGTDKPTLTVVNDKDIRLNIK